MRGGEVKYSPDADALVIALRDEEPDHGEEAAPGVILHYGRSGELVEIEILGASRLLTEMVRALVDAARERAAAPPTR